MKWKLELDALITMAFAKDIKRGQPIADLPVAKRSAAPLLQRRFVLSRSAPVTRKAGMWATRAPIRPSYRPY